MELQQLANDAIAIHYALQKADKLEGEDFDEAMDRIEDMCDQLHGGVSQAIEESEFSEYEEEDD
jgi:DNA/RNA-binding domain of Phe-tRNA-synthetase-like protein